MAKRIPKKAFKKFVKKAIKRKGALSSRAKSEGKTTEAEALENKKSGTPLEKKQANFFLNFLLPRIKKLKSKRSLLK